MDLFFNGILCAIAVFIYFLISSNSMRDVVIGSSAKRNDYETNSVVFDDRPSVVFKPMFTEDSILI